MSKCGGLNRGKHNILTLTILINNYRAGVESLARRARYLEER